VCQGGVEGEGKRKENPKPWRGLSAIKRFFLEKKASQEWFRKGGGGEKEPESRGVRERPPAQTIKKQKKDTEKGKKKRQNTSGPEVKER